MRRSVHRMKEGRVHIFLRILQHALHMRGLSDADVLTEIENHLLEAVDQGVRQGLSVEEAEQQALDRFGPAELIANAFDKERNTSMQNLLLSAALISGLFCAYVDALPRWDDTGILAGSLLLVSGLLTLLGHRRPWLIALALGLWIPLHDIYLTHDFKMLLVLLFPLAGAYAGWAVRLGIRKTLHLA
jgi:hypothetical protein